MEDVRSAPFIRPLLWQQRGGLLGGHALAGVQGKAIGIDRSGDSRNAEGVNLRAAEEGGAGFTSEKGKNHHALCRKHQTTVFIPRPPYPRGLHRLYNPPPKKQKQNKINKLIKLNGWGTLNWLLGKTKPRQQLQGQHGPQSICLRNGTEGRKE